MSLHDLRTKLRLEKIKINLNLKLLSYEFNKYVEEEMLQYLRNHNFSFTTTSTIRHVIKVSLFTTVNLQLWLLGC